MAIKFFASLGVGTGGIVKFYDVLQAAGRNCRKRGRAASDFLLSMTTHDRTSFFISLQSTSFHMRRTHCHNLSITSSASNPKPPSTMNRSGQWRGPRKAAICITMDNLGEAQDVYKGTWDKPIGTHPSITDQLPRMLNMLDKYNIKITYFIEAWSLSVYPDVVNDIIARGHEVAWHGLQHELWASLSPEEVREKLGKSFEMAGKLGIRYHGFRPPGGGLGDHTSSDLMKERGLEYISPVVVDMEDRCLDHRNGITRLPLEWPEVDAFYYMEKFDKIRSAHRRQTEVITPGQFKEHLMKKIDLALEDEGLLCILFHPFLQTSEDKLEVFEDVLKRVANDSEIFSVPCREVAKIVSQWQ